MSSQFIPLNDNHIYYINPLCNIYLLNELLAFVRKTRYFTMEHKLHQNLPVIIVEIIHQQKSIVLIIEADHFVFNISQEEPLTIYRWLLRSLFKCIFRSENVIYSWGSLTDTNSFIRLANLFSKEFSKEHNIIDIQNEFKHWYPAKYANKSLDNHRWSLAQATLLAFNQVLEQSNSFETCLAITKLAHILGQDTPW